MTRYEYKIIDTGSHPTSGEPRTSKQAAGDAAHARATAPSCLGSCARRLAQAGVA